MPKQTTSDEKCYIGIDPGKQGGLVLLSGNNIEWVVMPASDLDLYNVLRRWKSSHDIECAFLEQVSSRPGEGHKGTFTFGEGYGKLQMALAGNQIRYEKVTPRTWMKGLCIPVTRANESRKDYKERLRQTAQSLFPSLLLWNVSNNLGVQRAVCDAMLIAEYCKRKHEYKV